MSHHDTISFRMIGTALLHQWKWILLSTAFFAALGIGTACLYAPLGAAPPNGTAEPLAPADLSSDMDVPQASDYLVEKTRQALRYGTVLQQDTALTDAQKAALEPHISFLREQLLQRLAEERLLDSGTQSAVGNPTDLQTAVDALNTEQETLVACADEICLENALLLKTDPKQDGTFDPVVYHGHWEAPVEEAFAIIALFSTLVGLCFGLFWAVCREAAQNKHKDGNVSDE